MDKLFRIGGGSWWTIHVKLVEMKNCWSAIPGSGLRKSGAAVG